MIKVFFCSSCYTADLSPLLYETTPFSLSLIDNKTFHKYYEYHVKDLKLRYAVGVVVVVAVVGDVYFR